MVTYKSTLNPMFSGLDNIVSQLAIDLDYMRRINLAGGYLSTNSCDANVTAWLKCIVETFEKVVPHLNKNDINSLRKNGLDAFKDDEIRMRYECASLEFQKMSMHKKTPLINALNGLLAKKNGKPIISPAIIQTELGNISIANLYLCGSDLVKEIKHLYKKLPEDNPSVYYRIVVDSSRGFKALISNPEINEILRTRGFKELASNPEFREKALSCFLSKGKQNSARDSIVSLMRLASPEQLGKANFHSKVEDRKYYIINDHKVDVSKLEEVSPLLKNDVVNYSNKINPTKKRLFELFSLLGKMLTEYLPELNEHQRDKIYKLGGKAFLDNDCELLLWINDKKELALRNLSERKGSKKGAVNEVFNRDVKAANHLINILSYIAGYDIDVREFQEWYLKFPMEGSTSNNSYVDINDIYKLSPVLANDLKLTIASELNNRDSDATTVSTVKTIAIAFQCGIRRSFNSFSSKQIERLKKDGIRAFDGEGYQILKLVLKNIQESYKEGSLSRSSAKSENGAVKKILGKNNIEFIDVYPIRDGKRRKHQKINARKTNFYSNEEVVQLAFNVEKLLSLGSVPHAKELNLRVARVLIKTGWNSTPLCEMECDDIIKIGSQNNGLEVHFVRLLKRRANYKTEWDKFTIDSSELDWSNLKSGRSVRSALKDLVYIRDVLSKPLRDRLPDDHPLKKSIMIYQGSNGEVRRLTAANNAQRVNYSLKSECGCKIKFAPTFIRNSGMNFMYQSVEKDFKKYNKVAGHHTFEVFMNNYFRLDVNKSQVKLSDALKIMGDYYHGRPISGDIKIITEVTNDMLRVPNGICTSKGDDEETIAYLRSHHKLHKLNKRKHPRCGEFNACLWCDKYRAIAISEQVWKLLSYRDYVIADMQASVSDFERVEHQQEYIDLLTLRVNQVIDELDDLNSGIREQGEKLLYENGPHPDWSPYITSLTNDTEEM